MRFLLDQDVYAITARFLRSLGQDVVTAAELGLARATDAHLLSRASQEKRLFVTRDKDFGGLVFVEQFGKGVLYLRIAPSSVEATHAEFKRILQNYTEAELARAFVVVEPGRHRFRMLE